MTKWFDTNYHYLVPEFSSHTSFSLASEQLFAEVAQAQALGHPVKAVLLGPLSFLWLGKEKEAGFQRLALLDHDVFPLAPTSLCQSLGQRPFYGVKRIMEHGWYLWPGWCLFSFDFLLKHQPDFLPIYVSDSYLDAGGNNFFRLFQSLSPMNTEFPMVKTHRIKKTKGLTRHDEIYHGDCIQIIEGKWVHIINGSNCAHIPGKEKVVQKLLDNLDRLQPYTS